MDFRKNGTLTIRRKRNGRLESHPGVSEGVVEAILVVGYDEKGVPSGGILSASRLQ